MFLDKISGLRLSTDWPMAVGYFRKNFVWDAWLISIDSFTLLIINLYVCFKSVYTGRFSLLFLCVSMFYHFCLRNLYMKTSVKTFFNLLI